MCLFVKSIKPPVKPVWVYKMLELNSTPGEWELMSPYQYTPVKSGWFVAEGDSYGATNPYRGCSIDGGAIHAWKSLRTAKSEAGTQRVVIRCRAYPADYIATGKNKDVCYKRVFIGHDDYLAAVAEAKAQRLAYYGPQLSA